ncbi:MAG: tetratricopeptide repeat protein [Bacteroidota bacterium]
MMIQLIKQLFNCTSTSLYNLSTSPSVATQKNLLPRLFLTIGLVWLLVGVGQPARAQMLTDTVMQRMVRQSLGKMYNFDFETSEKIVAKVHQMQPKHPVYPLIMALNLYWKNMPINEATPAFNKYQAYLEQCITLSKAMLDRNEDDPEGIFFAASAYSYMALQSSDSGNFLKAVSEARRMYGYMKQGFDLTDENPEFFLPTGVYNYYAEQYPESHPIVKPLMWFFADGDKARGLEQLKTGMKKGTFTKEEAAYRLLDIYSKHEAQPLKALEYSTWLATRYPLNLLFVARQAEMLVACGRYDAAQPYLKQLTASGKAMSQRVAEILRAVIQEKQKKDDRVALKGYLEETNLDSSQKQFIRDLYATAYAGAARVYARQGNAAKAREYYKKAQDMAESLTTMQEAKVYLKKN